MSAKENGISGRVILRFTIDTDESICDVKVFQGISPELDEEAVRVVSMSPRWKPGTLDGHSVKVSYIFSVIFRIR